MQICTGCNNKLSWFSMVKSIWLGYKPIHCTNCQKQYSISFKTRYKTTISMIIPLFVFAMVVSNAFPFPTIVNVSMLLLFGLLITLVVPFFINYNAD